MIQRSVRQLIQAAAVSEGAGVTVHRSIGTSALRGLEPVVQYGPFVMNTREEIEQALSDYREGRLVRKQAAMTGT